MLKVLLLTPYVYVKNRFEYNHTGFGLMVERIAFSVAKQGNQVKVLTQNSFLKESFMSNDVTYLKRNLFSDVLRNFRWKDLFFSLKFINKYKGGSLKLKVVLYFLSFGHILKTIEKESPDIVHIHGIGIATLPFIMACIEKKQKFIVTLHGLISFSDTINTCFHEKNIEKQFLMLINKHNIPVTVISTGIQKEINKYLGVSTCPSLKVVLNGTNIHIKNKVEKNTDFVNLVAIGNVCKRKNQIQIVRGISLLDSSILERIKLYVIGQNDDTEICKLVEELDLSDKIIFTGSIPYEEVNGYLSKADGNILASRSEGFGLSIIEGFIHGIPSLCFSDIDAIEDLHDKDCMELVLSEDDISFSRGIENLISRKWDKKLIKLHGCKFSLENMAESYSHIYQENFKMDNVSVKDFINSFYQI